MYVAYRKLLVAAIKQENYYVFYIQIWEEKKYFPVKTKNVFIVVILFFFQDTFVKININFNSTKTAVNVNGNQSRKQLPIYKSNRRRAAFGVTRLAPWWQHNQNSRCFLLFFGPKWTPQRNIWLLNVAFSVICLSLRQVACSWFIRASSAVKVACCVWKLHWWEPEQLSRGLTSQNNEQKDIKALRVTPVNIQVMLMWSIANIKHVLRPL